VLLRRQGHLALAAGAVAAVAVAGSGSAAATQPAAPTATKLTVTATEFKFKLSKPSVLKGIVMITLINNGKQAHDLLIKGVKPKSKYLGPGQKQTFKVTFVRAGRFPFLCTVDAHASKGMKGILKIQ
jgi:plastocyanin